MHIDTIKILKETFYKLFLVILSWLILFLAKFDSGAAWVALFFFVISILIFVEFFYIRKTAAKLFSEAIARHKLLKIFLEAKTVNFALSLVVSAYLGFNLLVFISVADSFRMMFFIVGGLLYAYLYQPFGVGRITQDSDNAALTPVAGKIAARVGIVIFISIVMVISDGFYQAIQSVDPRIKEVFDPYIPAYVSSDVNHSFVYFQHYLRTIMYVEYNIDSLSLLPGFGRWFFLLKFVLFLSPAPYIAYIFILLSLDSIKIRVHQDD